VGNSCPHSLWGWNSGGDHNASRVSVNPVSVTWSSSQKKEIKKVRYRHFWDVTGEALPFEEANPNATGYALSPLFSHEVGHSLGMNHSDEWPAALGMVSTMQSFIRTITPFDLAFLKHFYGLKSGESAIKKSDLTASHLVRYNKSESDSDLQYKNYNFGTDSSSSDLGRINPLYLYYSNGQFLDCRTSQTPRFHATWFNNGTQEIKGSSDLIASFTTHSLASLSTTLTLGSFEIGDMEGLSQRYWSGQVLFPSADVAMPSTSSSEVITVSFTLDPKHKLAEASEANNTVTAAVTLYRSKASCSRQPAKNAVAGYLDSDGRISGYP